MQVSGRGLSVIGAAGLALVVAFLWLLGQPAQVHACSCVVPGSPSEEIDKFDAVFAGRVVSIEHSFGPDKLPSPGDQTTIGFQVSAVWKGAVSRDMDVTTPPTGGACGFAFEQGQEYIVYAYDSADADRGYSVNICSRTALLAEAQEDLDAFGAGDAPPSGAGGPRSEAPTAPDDDTVTMVVVSVVAAMIIIGALLSAVWVTRRRTG